MSEKEIKKLKKVIHPKSRKAAKLSRKISRFEF